jgi:type I restriction enzyme S subunit
MVGDFADTTLDRLLSFANGRSSPERADDLPYPVYGSNGVIGRASEANADEGSIIIGRVGSYCGSLYLSKQRCWVTDNAIRATALDDNDSRFLFYLLGTLSLNNWRAGSGQPLLNQDILSRIPATVPEPVEQRVIAHILGTLDDKIELNRRMNETLEAMARALFKSWFVDFDPVRAKAEGRDSGLPKPLDDLFQDSFEDSDLGEIPRGWSVATLGDVCNVIDCLHSKKPERRDSGRPLLQLSNIRDNGLIDMADTYLIDEAAYDQWITRMEASEGDCVVTNVGRVGAVAQIPRGFTAALGRNMTGVRCKATFPFPTFIIENLLSEAMQDEMSLNTDSGTILDALNVRNIPRLRFMRASPQVLQRFEQLTRPLRARMEEGLAQSRTLAALRDTLLPKLISGELRVKDGERVCERVGA